MKKERIKVKIIFKGSFAIFLSMIFIPGLHPQAAFKTGKIVISVNEFGNIKLSVPNDRNKLNIYRTAILVGVSSDQVFDYFNDSENEDSVKLDTLGGLSDYRIFGAFNNDDSNLPPEVLIKLDVYGWKNASYTLLKFNIQNKNTASINAVAGLEIIPQIKGTEEADTVSYLFNSGIIDIFQENHIGYKLLSGQLSSIKTFEYFDGYENDSSFYSWLTYGTIDTFFTSNDADTIDNGAVTIPSQAPVLLNSNDSLIIYYALAFGNTRDEMVSNINNAESKFTVLTSVNGAAPIAADRIDLYQNYPNPFNPLTNIEFRLPQKLQFVQLKVYDILGKEVSTIVSDYLQGGFYKYSWNGAGLASGAYFYQLTAGSYIETKKMILLR
jgi:hypothetical protein